MRPARLLVLVPLLILGAVAIALLSAFWLPLVLFAMLVGLSLWLVRRYYLDSLDSLDDSGEHRPGR